MRTPPFLLSAALLLWGGQSRLILAALVMAAVLESARFVRIRWDFSESDIRRIADLCTILLAIGVLVALIIDRSRFLIRTLQWMPMPLFPLIATQQYSRAGKIHLQALLLLFRRARAKPPRPPWLFDISYPYFLLCLLSAGGANTGRDWFYGGLFLLIAWAAWPLRSRKYPAYLWALLLMAAGSAGYAGQLGLYRLHSVLLEKSLDYFARQRDPFQSTTSIGEVVTLKQSHRILFRIMPDPGISLPIRLRQACYSAYDRATWYATHSGFEALLPEQTDAGLWTIAPPQTNARSARIVMRLPKGWHLLALPGGTFRLRDLNASRLEKNSLGAVRSDQEGGLVLFRVDYAPAPVFNRPPDEIDLKIPATEAPAIRAVAERLALEAKSPREALAAIQAFFGQTFRYTLTLAARPSSGSDLADFLLRTRAGHCEYFATATVLLLRAAGIPARYVSGYVAGEYSPLEENIVVRQSHAHAWALAYVSGQWVEVDTTPPDWLSAESAGISGLVRVSDFFSFLRLRFALWRHRLQMEEQTLYLMAALVALSILFIKRLTGRKHMRRVIVPTAEARPPADRPGQASEFYAVEQWLKRLGYERPPGETFQAWFQRLAAGPAEIQRIEDIQPLLALHYRYRFGPDALPPEDRERLRTGVKAFIGQALAPPRPHRPN